MTTISLFIPTRQRFCLLNRLLDSIKKTTFDLNRIEILLYIDRDDHSYDHLNRNFNIKKIIGDKVSMGTCHSICLKQSTGDIIILLNDDIVIRTQHWDEKLLKAIQKFPDEIYLAYPNDLHKGKNLAVFPILSRKTCEILQDPFPALYQSFFIDTHSFDVFLRLKHQRFNRILYLSDIIFEHMHPRLYKIPLDNTYKARNRFSDDFNFVILAPMRKQQTELLINYIVHQKITGNLKSIVFSTPSAKNIFATSLALYQNFLKDSQLPWKRRIYLFHYHLARYLAAKILK